MTNGQESGLAPATQEAPATQATITPGTAIVGTSTIASLFSALWTNIVAGPNAGSVAYRWSDQFTIQAYYGDGTVLMFHGEARPSGGTTVALQ
jgi:hypothetical protein